MTTPIEQPPTGTPCIVMACRTPAAEYVAIAHYDALDDQTGIPMCDEHAHHWRDA